MPNLETAKAHLSGRATAPSSRKQVFAVVGISLLALVLTITFGTYASYQFLKMRSVWSQYADRESKFNTSLEDIQRTLGYGGFIHNFKNLVLRKDLKTYGPAVERDYHDLVKTLQKLDTLVRYPEDRDAIKKIMATVNTYFNNFKIAKRMIQEGASSAQIDLLVRVDDAPALHAISILEASVRKDLLSTRRQTETLTNAALSNIFISEVIIFLSLILATIEIARLNKHILDSNTSLSLAQKSLNNLLENSPDAMLTVDEDGLIIRANSMAERFFGFSKTELTGMSIEQLVPEQHRSAHARLRASYLAQPTIRSMGSGISLIALTKDGRTPNVDISLSYVKESGIMFTNVTLRDTTRREQDKRELENAAFTDMLTGIANRRKFFDFTEREIARSKRSGTQLWFLVIDIDDFKKINDTMGHHVGDSVIEAVAGALESSIRSVDLVCRSGGEEFAILLVDTTETGVSRVAETILSSIRKLEIDQWTEKHGPVTVSIGCALHDQTQDLKTTLKMADEAMYESKKNGKNQFTIYTRTHSQESKN